MTEDDSIHFLHINARYRYMVTPMDHSLWSGKQSSPPKMFTTNQLVTEDDMLGHFFFRVNFVSQNFNDNYLRVRHIALGGLLMPIVSSTPSLCMAIAPAALVHLQLHHAR